MDGAAQAQQFIDNGDGTISDPKTRLTWEKKTADSSVHDVNNTYTWSFGATGPPNGTAFRRFLASLNGRDYYDRSVGLVDGLRTCRA
jgi:hypothetical protein